MSKFNEFLNQTSDMSNKDRIQTVLCTVALTGMAMVLNHKLYKERLKNINLEIESSTKDIELDLLKKRIMIQEETTEE